MEDEIQAGCDYGDIFINLKAEEVNVIGANLKPTSRYVKKA